MRSIVCENQGSPFFIINLRWLHCW